MTEKNNDLICISAADQLPVVEILSRLPVKSLLRFKCVCKAWRILIEDPSFIALHVHQFEKNDCGFLLYTDGIYTYNPEHVKWSLRGKEISGEILRMRSRKAVTVGSCDGLICQFHLVPCDPFMVEIIHICNPSTGKLMRLPLSPAIIYTYPFGDFPSYCFLGFGLCPKSNDYKVVKMVYYRNNTAPRPYEIEVYSVRRNSWEKINFTAATTFPYSHWRSHNKFRSTCINGACHWLGILELQQGVHDISSPQLQQGVHLSSPQYILLSYKFEEKVLQETKVPINYEYGRVPVIREYEDWVSLISVEEGKFNVWVMKEFGVAESWVKQFTIQVEVPEHETIDDFQVTSFRNNGRVLLVKTNHFNRRVICYDTKAHKTEEEYEILGRFENVINFKESLVSLPGEISY